MCFLAFTSFTVDAASDAAARVPVSAGGLDDEDADVSSTLISPTVSGLAPQTKDKGPAGPVLKGVVDDAPALRWDVPPIPWRGSLALSGGTSIPAEGGASTFFNQTFTAAGASYVWQPWFLKLNGSLAFGRSQDQSPTASTQSSSLGFGGGGNLLPATRYPVSFTGGYTRNTADSRPKEGDGTHTESQTTSVGLNFIYSPPGGGYASTWSFNQLNAESFTESGQGGLANQNSTSRNFAADLAVPLRTVNPQSLTFNANVSTTNNPTVEARSRVGAVNAAHSVYLEDYVMTLSTNAQLNQNNADTPDSSNRSTTSNITTNMDWVPSDDYPINVGANAGYFRSKAGADTNQFQLDIANFLGNLRYPFDKAWSFQGQMNLAKASTQNLGTTSSNLSYGLSGSASWSGEGVRAKWNDWDYSLTYGVGTGLGYGGSSSSDADSKREGTYNGSANFGQGLGRSYPVTNGSPVLVNFSEGYGASVTGSGGGVTHSINHAATVAWSSSGTSAVRKQFSASASDGRSLGASGQYFQQLSGNATFQTETGPYSSISGSATVGYSRQGGGNSSRGIANAGSGVRYTHARFANVSGLTYEARYDLAIKENPGLSSDTGQSAGGVLLENLISQGWAWRFGLLGWRVDHTLTKIGKAGINQSLFLSVVRDFSGVL